MKITSEANRIDFLFRQLEDTFKQKQNYEYFKQSFVDKVTQEETSPLLIGINTLIKYKEEEMKKINNQIAENVQLVGVRKGGN